MNLGAVPPSHHHGTSKFRIVYLLSELRVSGDFWIGIGREQRARCSGADSRHRRGVRSIERQGQFIRIPKTRSLADSMFWRWPSLRAGGETSLSSLGFSREYRDQVHSWQTGQRPVVAGRAEFSVGAVIAAWHSVLEVPV